MRFNGVCVILALSSFISITGCSNTNEEVDNTSGIEQSSNDSKDTIAEPPSLTIYAGDEIIRPILGTYSWSIDNGDGTDSGIEADSDAPPELVKDSNLTQVTTVTNIDLDFEEEPDSYTVRIWDEDNTILSESNEVDLSGEGEFVYEVLAQWEEGTASYAFSLTIE